MIPEIMRTKCIPGIPACQFSLEMALSNVFKIWFGMGPPFCSACKQNSDHSTKSKPAKRALERIPHEGGCGKSENPRPYNSFDHCPADSSETFYRPHAHNRRGNHMRG